MTNDHMPDQWDRTLVKNAFVDAYRVLLALPGVKMPGRLKAYWPEEGASPSVRISPKPHEISQAEAVLVGIGTTKSWLRWLEEADPERARVLALWALWVSHDCLLGGHRVSEAEFARIKLKMPLATFKRHREVAAKLVAIWLQRNKVTPWVAPKPRGAAKEHRRSPRYAREARPEDWNVPEPTA